MENKFSFIIDLRLLVPEKAASRAPETILLRGASRGGLVICPLHELLLPFFQEETFF